MSDVTIAKLLTCALISALLIAVYADLRYANAVEQTNKAYTECVSYLTNGDTPHSRPEVVHFFCTKYAEREVQEENDSK